MQVLVFQYDFQSAQFIAAKSEIMPEGATLKQAQARSKEFWEELESDQPKQIFIRDGSEKNIYYYDNFKHFVCRPEESN